jgi:hypothetical protein
MRMNLLRLTQRNLSRPRTVGPVLLIATCLCSLDLFAGSQHRLLEQAEHHAVFEERLGHLAVAPATGAKIAADEAGRIRRIAAGTQGVTLVMPANDAIAIFLSDPARLPASRDLLAASLKRAGISTDVRFGPESSGRYRMARENAAVKLQSMLAAVLVAIAAVMVATASMNCLARRREHAMLRALGVSPRGLFKYVVQEALMVAVSGIVLGFVSSTGLSWVGNRMAASSLGWRLALEPDPVRQLAAAAVVLAVVFLAVLGPAWRAARHDVASGLSDTVA